VRRRDAIGLITAAAAWPLTARAQNAAKRIAWLGFARNPHLERAFAERLQQLGYVQGRDYEIDMRVGDVARMPALAEELVARRPDVFVAGNSAAALAAKRATGSIPVVIGASYDPVSLGLASTYARPEGNVTGMVAGWDTVVGKQLELGLELVPGGRMAGMLLDVSSPASASYRRGAETATTSKGVTVFPAEVKTTAKIEPVVEELAQQKVSFVIVQPSPMFLTERQRIAGLALVHRLPIVCAFREHAEAGGLISYGADLRENFRQVALYVDKIFKGANPADLPIEQPTRFELVINLNTARALGLTIPPTLLARADEVIE